jgi:hypothetical protein
MRMNRISFELALSVRDFDKSTFKAAKNCNSSNELEYRLTTHLNLPTLKTKFGLKLKTGILF